MTRILAALMDPMPHRHIRLGAMAMLCFGTMSLVWALLLGWFRLDFGGPGFALMLAASLVAIAMMALWIVLVVLVREGVLSSMALAALIMFVILVFAPALALLPQGRTIAAVLAISVIALACLPLRASLAMVPLWQRLGLPLLGAVLALIYALSMNALTYSHFFGPEIARAGAQHADPLFHAAISEMLVQYATVSTGLDGLIPISYHVLSHLWLGLTGRLLGVSTLEAYMFGPQVIGVPLLLFSGVAAIGPALLRARDDAPAEFWIIPVLAGVLALIDIKDAYAYLASESYLLSLIGVFFGFAALNDIAGSNALFESRRAWLRDISLAGLTILLVLTKVSSGAIFAVGAFYVVSVSRQWPLARIVMVALAAGLAGFGIVWLFLSSAHSAMSFFDPFHFVRAYRDIAWVNVYACLAIVLAIPLLWLRGEAPMRQRLVAALLMVLTGFIPAMLLSIGGGSAYYFINVGTMIAVLLATALSVTIASQRRSFDLVLAAFAGLALIAGLMLDPRKSGAIAAMDARAAAMIAHLEKGAGGPRPRAKPPSPVQQPLASLRTHDLDALLADSIGTRLQSAIKLIPTEYAGSTLLHVPSSYRSFWSAHPTHCRNAPLQGPALSGLPMLKGLPPAEMACDFRGLYAYPEYSTADSAARDLSDEAACALARAKQFKAVLSLPEKGAPRLIRCGV